MENYLGIRRKIKDGRKYMKMKETMQKMQYLINGTQRKEGKERRAHYPQKCTRKFPCT